MRRGLGIAMGVALLFVLAGCSGGSASSTSVPTPISILGSTGETSGSIEATVATAAPSPAEVEGVPPTIPIQVSAAEGTTRIDQAAAIKAADAVKPKGAKSVAVRHVLYARQGVNTPTEAWMVTFHDAQLPGPGGTPTDKIGSVSVMIDVTSGKVLDTFAYEPTAKQ